MHCSVIIRPRHDGGFTATVPMLPGCRSQGKTEEEALNGIRTAITNHLKSAKVVQIQIEENGNPNENPWNTIVGMFENDPIFDEVDQEIQKKRKI